MGEYKFIQQDQRSSGRYESLDCLRGLAALTVLFGHSLLLMTQPSPIFEILGGMNPSRVLVSGHQAVILFFVLCA